MDQDWQVLAVYQTTNDSASSIPCHHLRSSMSTACCSELPRLQTKSFASPQNTICNTFLNKTFVLRTGLPKNLSHHGAKGKFILQSTPKLCTNICISSKTEFLPTSEMTSLGQPCLAANRRKRLMWESRCFVRLRLIARLAAQMDNVTHSLNRVELSCLDWNIFLT